MYRSATMYLFSISLIGACILTITNTLAKDVEPKSTNIQKEVQTRPAAKYESEPRYAGQYLEGENAPLQSPNGQGMSEKRVINPFTYYFNYFRPYFGGGSYPGTGYGGNYGNYRGPGASYGGYRGSVFNGGNSGSSFSGGSGYGGYLASSLNGGNGFGGYEASSFSSGNGDYGASANNGGFGTSGFNGGYGSSGGYGADYGGYDYGSYGGYYR